MSLNSSNLDLGSISGLNTAPACASTPATKSLYVPPQTVRSDDTSVNSPRLNPDLVALLVWATETGTDVEL